MKGALASLFRLWLLVTLGMFWLGAVAAIVDPVADLGVRLAAAVVFGGLSLPIVQILAGLLDGDRPDGG